MGECTKTRKEASYGPPLDLDAERYLGPNKKPVTFEQRGLSLSTEVKQRAKNLLERSADFGKT